MYKLPIYNNLLEDCLLGAAKGRERERRSYEGEGEFKPTLDFLLPSSFARLLLSAVHA